VIRLVNALLRYHRLCPEPERLSDTAWASAFADLRWIADTQQLNLPPLLKDFHP
jgi:hypothetical protein